MRTAAFALAFSACAATAVAAPRESVTPILELASSPKKHVGKRLVTEGMLSGPIDFSGPERIKLTLTDGKRRIDCSLDREALDKAKKERLAGLLSGARIRLKGRLRHAKTGYEFRAMEVDSLPVIESGPANACAADSDCWCRQFNGAAFGDGQDPGRCCRQAGPGCPSLNHCATCTYE